MSRYSGFLRSYLVDCVAIKLDTTHKPVVTFKGDNLQLD